MKKLIVIILFEIFISCNNKNTQLLIEGKWRHDDTKTGCELIFENGFYNITRWNDDLVNTSKGRYFLNENQARIKITVTLVPDLQYSEGDTIYLPCENIDIVSITDSFLIIQKPTQWVRNTEGATARKNITELYKKIKI
jgi:hypothetical protein